MVTAKDIFENLCALAPLELQLSFDNSGFLFGRETAAVTKALLALDVTSTVVDEAIEQGVELILSHHPLIFSPLKSVTDEKLLQLARHQIAVISMHTNLDIAQGGVNDLLARTMGLVGVDPFAGLGRVGTLPSTTTARGLAEATAEALGVHVKWADGGKPIRRLAVVGGAAGDMWRQAKAEGADALLTGEVSHHEALDAKEAGFSLLAAGHYGTEWPIAAEIACRLQEAFPDVKVVRSEANTDPFEYL